MRNSLLAILTATFATLCCTGPVLLAFLGATSMASFAWVEPFRPYLSIGVLGLLGWAFWRSYRPQTRAACCTVDQRAVLRRQHRAFLTVTPIIVLLLAFPYFLGTSAISQNTGQILGTTATESHWAIAGMTCPGCAAGLEASLTTREGMLTCDVSYQESRMLCVVDETRLDKTAIPALVDELGYKARLLNVLVPSSKREGT